MMSNSTSMVDGVSSRIPASLQLGTASAARVEANQRQGSSLQAIPVAWEENNLTASHHIALPRQRQESRTSCLPTSSSVSNCIPHGHRRDSLQTCPNASISILDHRHDTAKRDRPRSQPLTAFNRNFQHINKQPARPLLLFISSAPSKSSKSSAQKTSMLRHLHLPPSQGPCSSMSL